MHVRFGMLWLAFALARPAGAAPPRAVPAWIEVHDLPASVAPTAVACPPPPEVTRPVVEKLAEPPWPLDELDLDAPDPATPAGLLAAARGPAAVRELPLSGLPEDVARVRAAASSPGARIGVWGDSHSARGPLVNALRAALQARGGDGGVGFVPVKGSAPDGASVCLSPGWSTVASEGPRAGYRDLGPAGLVIAASAPEAHGWVEADASRLTLAFERGPAGGALDVTVDDGAPIRVSTRGAGPGGLAFTVAAGRHRVAFRPAGDGPVLVVGVFAEREGPGVVVDNLAVAGRTASTWRRLEPTALAAWLGWLDHDVIVLQYGTNETTDAALMEVSYAEELARSLLAVRTQLPDVPCLLIGPPDRGIRRGKGRFAIFQSVAWVGSVQASLGPRFGCATWSMQEVMGGPGSSVAWRRAAPPWMGADLVHLTTEGSQQVGRALARAL